MNSMINKIQSKALYIVDKGEVSPYKLNLYHCENGTSFIYIVYSVYSLKFALPIFVYFIRSKELTGI